MDRLPVTVMTDMLDGDVINALRVIQEIHWYRETLANKVNKLKRTKSLWPDKQRHVNIV